MTSTANSQSTSLCFPSAEDLEPFLGGGTLLQKAVKAFPLFLLYAAVCGAAVALRWILAFPKFRFHGGTHYGEQSLHPIRCAAQTAKA